MRFRLIVDMWDVGHLLLDVLLSAVVLNTNRIVLRHRLYSMYMLSSTRVVLVNINFRTASKVTVRSDTFILRNLNGPQKNSLNRIKQIWI